MIKREKIYAEKATSAQTSLLALINNHHLPFELPKLSQVQSYIYSQKIKILHETYPDISKFIKDISKVRYSENLAADEVFYIESTISEDEVSILFATKALLCNLVNQVAHQPLFLHVNSTYKLIDLRFPVVHVSTETLNHNYRPLCFFITESETTDKIAKMLRLLQNFYRENLNFELRPEYIVSDNADNIISACRKVFGLQFTHLTCLFHLKKGVNEKLKKNILKPYEKTIWYGIKSLKNCNDYQMLTKVWKLIKSHWETNEVPNDFIKVFYDEYIKKNVVWYNGASFAGKGRTNNSLESGKGFNLTF